MNLVKTGPAKNLSALSVFSIGKWQEGGRADLHQTSGCRAGCGSASVPAADTRGSSGPAQKLSTQSRRAPRLFSPSVSFQIKKKKTAFSFSIKKKNSTSNSSAFALLPRPRCPALHHPPHAHDHTALPRLHGPVSSPLLAPPPPLFPASLYGTPDRRQHDRKTLNFRI